MTQEEQKETYQVGFECRAEAHTLYLWRTHMSCIQDVCSLVIENIEGMWTLRSPSAQLLDT